MTWRDSLGRPATDDFPTRAEADAFAAIIANPESVQRIDTYRALECFRVFGYPHPDAICRYEADAFDRRGKTTSTITNPAPETSPVNDHSYGLGKRN